MKWIETRLQACGRNVWSSDRQRRPVHAMPSLERSARVATVRDDARGGAEMLDGPSLSLRSMPARSGSPRQLTLTPARRSADPAWIARGVR